MATKFAFRIEVSTHDQTGKVLAVYFQVRKGKAATVKEIQPGTVFANYSSSRRLLGIELLAPCQVSVLDKAARDKSDRAGQKAVRKFFRENGPRSMVLVNS